MNAELGVFVVPGDVVDVIALPTPTGVIVCVGLRDDVWVVDDEGSSWRHDESEAFPTVSRSVLPPFPRPFFSPFPATRSTLVPASTSTVQSEQSSESSLGSSMLGNGTAKVEPPGMIAQTETASTASGHDISSGVHCVGVLGFK